MIEIISNDTDLFDQPLQVGDRAYGKRLFGESKEVDESCESH